MPSSKVSLATSLHNEVLPMPGSPERSATEWVPSAAFLIASRRRSFSGWRPKNPNSEALVDSKRSGKGIPAVVVAGAHPTSHRVTGSGRPFSSRSPTSLKGWAQRRPAMDRTDSEARIWPPSHSTQIREASTTGSPK